jgi:hypothetical protein
MDGWTWKLRRAAEAAQTHEGQSVSAPQAPLPVNDRVVVPVSDDMNPEEPADSGPHRIGDFVAFVLRA